MLELKHKSMDVWKVSMNFAKYIYELTTTFPSSEKFGLTAHCRKTITSVVSNIAEGASRNLAADRRRFYRIARSSLVELDTQLELAILLGYIDSKYIRHIKSYLLRLFKMLSMLINRTN